jgi:hypothetical protein
MGNTAVECPIHELFNLFLLVIGWVHYESEEVQIVLEVVPDEPRMCIEELFKQPAVLVDPVQGILAIIQLLDLPRIVLDALEVQQRDQWIMGLLHIVTDCRPVFNMRAKCLERALFGWFSLAFHEANDVGVITGNADAYLVP